MVIYLDLVLLVNLIVNYFLLYITSRTVRIKVSDRKLILSAALGASYVIVKVYPFPAVFSSLVFKISVALIMIFLLFREKNIIFNLKALLIYMLHSMVLSGLCLFIEFSQYNSMDSYNTIYNFAYKNLLLDFDYKKLLLALIIIYMIIDRLIIYIKDRKDISTLIYNVDIVNKNLEKKVLAFLDTGNELREPVTNLPVMIIEQNYFDDFYLEDKDAFYIPYQVVNGSVGKLKGFKPECIKIHLGNEIKQREVIIALSDHKLSSLNDYHALLSRGII